MLFCTKKYCDKKKKVVGTEKNTLYLLLFLVISVHVNNTVT